MCVCIELNELRHASSEATASYIWQPCLRSEGHTWRVAGAMIACDRLDLGPGAACWSCGHVA